MKKAKPSLQKKKEKSICIPVESYINMLEDPQKIIKIAHDT